MKRTLIFGLSMVLIAGCERSDDQPDLRAANALLASNADSLRAELDEIRTERDAMRRTIESQSIQIAGLIELKAESDLRLAQAGSASAQYQVAVKQAVQTLESRMKRLTDLLAQQEARIRMADQELRRKIDWYRNAPPGTASPIEDLERALKEKRSDLQQLQLLTTETEQILTMLKHPIAQP